MHKKDSPFDFLIVGQGLAGSLMAWFLQQRSYKVCLIDQHHKGSSTKVAAGIINPVTGRRLVKSWMVDTLLPFAADTYRAIERQLGISLYQEKVIYRALPDIKAENQWDGRSADPTYAAYLDNQPLPEGVSAFFHPPFSWGSIHRAAQVDLPTLLTAFKARFESQGILFFQQFDYKQLQMESPGVQYQNIRARQVVFCEGQQGRFNPWFEYLPFVVSKGEVMEIAVETERRLPIVRHGCYIAPFGPKNYWVGATYDWNDLTESPTQQGRDKLRKYLVGSISVPYKITAHHAAIRPTVKDRRPFLGTHPTHRNLHIFNGLGTKGASLGPYWAHHFVEYLCGKHAVDERVDIRRFGSQ